MLDLKLNTICANNAISLVPKTFCYKTPSLSNPFYYGISTITETSSYHEYGLPHTMQTYQPALATKSA